MQTAVITIGRNVNETPMSNEVWQNFRADISSLIHFWSNETYTENALGTGNFTHADGRKVLEDSYTWVFSVEEKNVRHLKNKLHILAEGYEQESIALVLGQTTFC